jgi:hypothetical protein
MSVAPIIFKEERKKNHNSYKFETRILPSKSVGMHYVDAYMCVYQIIVE